jgi:hypothetical protein
MDATQVSPRRENVSPRAGRHSANHLPFVFFRLGESSWGIPLPCGIPPGGTSWVLLPGGSSWGTSWDIPLRGPGESPKRIPREKPAGGFPKGIRHTGSNMTIPPEVAPKRPPRKIFQDDAPKESAMETPRGQSPREGPRKIPKDISLKILQEDPPGGSRGAVRQVGV